MNRDVAKKHLDELVDEFINSHNFEKYTWPFPVLIDRFIEWVQDYTANKVVYK